MSYIMKFLGKSDQIKIEKIETYIRELIWFYVKKINHEGYISFTKLDEEIPK